MAVGVSLLGQLLLKAKLISEDQLNEAIRVQRLEGKRLGSVLLKLGYVNEESLITFLSRQYNAPAINLSEHKVDTSLLKIIPYETAKRYQLIPISKDGAGLRIAITDPSNNLAIDDVRFLSGMKVIVHVAAETAIMDAIEKYYPKKETKVSVGKGKGGDKDVMEMEDLNKVIGSALEDMTIVEEKDDKDMPREIDAPVVKLVNGILMNAIRSHASDIHVEPSEEILRVRYRIDGMLQPVLKLPVKMKNAITSRIKIMSHLDISERRLPQDGRIKLKFGDDREIDFRVSTLPTLFGEKIVMRLLDKSNLQLELPKLGFDEKQLMDFYDAIEKPYGMILVTGPTGSGKTTTLYSALSHLNKPGVNIMTAEDPVEYNFFGINQVHIREDIGLNFATALRSFLRQDPDIILVGEIRDFETAEIAIKAALTGHLVLSTLHTNDAPSTITRLINMGIEPIMVSSSVILIVAQRLARKICQNCKEEDQLSETTLIRAGFPSDKVQDVKYYIGKGCPECNNTGYRGRIAIHEIMPIRDEVKELILQGTSAADIKKEAVRLGMSTLRQSGLRKVMEGITTIEEILRVTFED
ncbi:MAG TPA: type IV-A pilus assembly ATPase PilB [Nitrospiraceae bacterium]|nr:MAG: type IV-A pilus assembly ATPase PilB [Nitrospirae bacterium GWA2_46_11]HCZ12791.1 type IV-A pilus assembly ATPase PilB [Nitrospiraceae bacterium]